MASLEGTLGPVQVDNRIQSLDVVRAIALFGILLMNITAFGLPAAYNDPTNAGGAEGLNRWAWITTNMFFEGTQRGLFTLLFGAGVILMTASLEAYGKPNATDVYFRRNLWLIVFGLVHGFLLLWTGEILYFYGITALFVYGFRHAQTSTLLGIAIGGVLFTAAWNGLDTYNGLKKHREYVAADSLKTAGDSLTAEQEGAIAAWEGMVKEFKPDSAKLQKEIDAKQGSYWDVLSFQAGYLTRWQSWGMYRYFFDFFSMMLLGMVVFRAGFFSGRVPHRTYWTMILLGYGVGLTVNYVETMHLLRENWSVPAFLRAGITYDIGRIPLTIGHLGVLMLFAHSGGFAALKRALAAVGRMAFTNYIMTSIICAVVFYGFGFGLYGQLQRYQLYYVVAGIWLVQLVFSPLWLARYRFGPLEYLWRWLTYGEKPVLRRG